MFRRPSPHILKITLPFHLLACAGLVALLVPVAGFRFYPLLAVIGYILFSGFGIAIGYHRLLSHRSFKTNRVTEIALSLLGCFAAQGSPLFWKAIHMGSHHPFSDREGDVHSPVNGYWHAFLGWQIFLSPKKVPFLAAKDLLVDRQQVFIHKNYHKIVWLPILVAGLLSPSFAFSFFIFPGLIAMHVENIVNTICHSPYFGYRSFETRDRSRNNIILGWLCFGQGWHNNHHYRPREYDYGGSRWFEFDPCSFFVPLLRRKDRTSTDCLKG